ncbi:hypothetical protein [Amycolatopsis pigmentata]|uniref:Subtilisin inhibitor-like n=1 Tax=Amycolatopsis pigmentata TaxID=450801 RepID=A0ABW5FR42_9PSEU
MTKRLIAVLPAMVAGVALLAACGSVSGNNAQPGNAPASAPSSQSAGSSSQALAGERTGSSSDQPTTGGIDCGAVTLPNGQPSSLIADSSDAGVVGCTEAFNVLDEYLKAPGNGSGTQRNKTLSRGWSCAVDAGAGATARSIICSNGKDDGQGGKTGGVSFHTEPG